MFGKDNGFTTEQISALVSIIKSVHEMAVDTPYGNVEPVFEYFKELVLCHSVKRPPYSVALFSVDQVKKYFRHFKMYKYAFTPKVRLDLSLEYVGLPVTPEPSEVGEGDEEGAGDTAQAVDEPDKTEEEAIHEEEAQTSLDQQIKAKDEEIAKKMEYFWDERAFSRHPEGSEKTTDLGVTSGQLKHTNEKSQVESAAIKASLLKAFKSCAVESQRRSRRSNGAMLKALAQFSGLSIIKHLFYFFIITPVDRLHQPRLFFTIRVYILGDYERRYS
ncbi:hypothetical protein OS493_009402 [Desmophyllum pertusum]|uniref:Uncharacterized protein n=1 Tax=Desmophyllum pertusum TaxID=174260 RepID=A0A9W9Z2N6_9CNID|nr:hypothetical protein OS493_009402 [Desmophyllum pertusum]